MGHNKFYILLFFIVNHVAIIRGQSVTRRFLNMYTLSPNAVTGYDEDPSFQQYDLTVISERCQKNQFFSSFDPNHSDAVNILTQYFIEQGDQDQLTNFSEYCKTNTNVHPKIWYEALTKTRLLIPTPNYPNLSPALLFPTSFFPESLLQNDTTDKCVVLDEKFGEDNGNENLLWYFREDVILNAHHWIWHLLHPFNTTAQIDRRGESFYFFHHDILARYTAERLSNYMSLQKTVNVLNKDAIVEEGYRSHLHEGISNQDYPDRQPFRHVFESIPKDMQGLFVNVSNERDRILETINQGGILHDDGFLELHPFDRINILGDISEASLVSINPRLYGRRGFHNQGHNFIAMIDAPPGLNQPRGPMIGSETAMRDIIFYRWHKWIDVFFQSYKLTHLKPYDLYSGDHPLVFKGIRVSSVKVAPESLPGEPVALNHLETFWNMKELDLGTTLDFNETRSLNICAKHLDHQEFKYHINIENSLGRSILATIRIFMAPRFNSQLKRYTMIEQRSLFFTMDSFQTVLSPGNNQLIRKSIDSTLTAPWPKSLKDIEDGINSTDGTISECECGFPHHLLLPKGNSKGMVFDLFVMVTNGLEDRVTDIGNSTVFNNDKCTASHIHCGIQGRKYPDRKPMGYPFDRKPYSIKQIGPYSPTPQEISRVVRNLEEYVHHIPNMHASQVIIQHHNELRSKS